ncbi:hypothetical protein [Enterovibrio coralii]|uniref:hypothetical protein n=1 Tax=Enterovibrio coralii TaxID=294935 RepID=UPI000A9FB4B5|nr:hypothetical protein [Enterovibrio coralii]
MVSYINTLALAENQSLTLAAGWQGEHSTSKTKEVVDGSEDNNNQWKLGICYYL